MTYILWAMEGNSMKKFKIFLLLTIIFCCSGWTGMYTLKEENNAFNENILYEFEYNVEEEAKKYFSISDGEFFESNLVYNDIYAIPGKALYTRTINSSNTSTVALNYTYSSFASFRKAKYASICFEKYNTEETNEYFYINLIGEYNCQGKGIEQISLITSKKLEGNYNAKEGNKYIWNILDTNNNIEIKIYKEVIGVEIFKIMVPAIGIGFLAFIIIFIINKKNNKI